MLIVPLSLSAIAWRYPTKQSSLIADEGEFANEAYDDDDDYDDDDGGGGDDEPPPLPTGFKLRGSVPLTKTLT